MNNSQTFITLEEFIVKLERKDLYSGFVAGVGYAYYLPVMSKPDHHSICKPQRIGPLNESEYTVAWLQKIDVSPEMRMLSLKEDTHKWTDFWGSTKLQRFAAVEFAAKTNGTVNNKNRSDIKVEYTEQVFDKKISKTQYFNADGTLVSQHGEIKQLKYMSLTYFEMWLDSPADSWDDFVLKIISNVGYSIVNSPKVLLTGSSWAGCEKNADGKMEAFIDVVPGFLLFGMSKVFPITKTTQKGLQ